MNEEWEIAESRYNGLLCVLHTGCNKDGTFIHVKGNVTANGRGEQNCFFCSMPVPKEIMEVVNVLAKMGLGIR